MSKMDLEQLEDLIIHFSSSMIEKETEEEILWDLTKTCIAKFGLEDCVVYLLEDDNKLHQKAAHGPKNPRGYDIHQPITIKLGEGITGMVALTGKAEIVNDTRQDDRYIVDDQNRLSEIAVPIMAGDRVLGVIDCEHSQSHYFNENHLKVLSAFASLCGIKLLNLRKDKDLIAEQKKLLQIERELIDMRVKALKAQMNPHFIFNALNSIQYFITNSDKKDALKYLITFSRLLRQYIDHLDQEYITLEGEVNMLKQYLDLQQLRYTDRIYYDLHLQEGLEGAMIPSLLLQLMLEDIVERHIMENTGRAHLMLNFSSESSDSMVATVAIKASQSARSDREGNNSYRSDKFTWQNHITLLKRLKSIDFKKNIAIQIEGDYLTTTYKLVVPLNFSLQ